MNRVNWTQVGVFTVVVLLVLLIGASLLGGFGRYGGYGPGMMGPGMTLAPARSAGVGGWGFAPFGGLAMIFMWVVPLGFLILLGSGIVWLVRAVSGSPYVSPPAPPVTGVCPACGRPTQAGWQHCPYCGKSLA